MMEEILSTYPDKLDSRIDVYFQNKFNFDEVILQKCFKITYKDVLATKKIFVEAADSCNDREAIEPFTLAHVVQNFN